MSEKPDREKRWAELPEDKRDSHAWESREKKFCPMTRKPCFEKIDPAGPDEPENYCACRFWENEFESCRVKELLVGLEDLGALVQLAGMNEFIKLHEDWPRDINGKRCRDWPRW